MSRDPDNYRPQSPDLSAFAPPPRTERLPSYHPDPAIPSGYPAHQHRNSYDASPYFSPATATPLASYFGAQPHSEATSFAPQYPSLLPSHSFTQANSNTQRYSTPGIAPPPPPPPPPPQYALDSPFNPPVHRPFQPDTPPNINMPRLRRRNSSADDSEDVLYTPNSTGLTRGAKKRKSEPDQPIHTPISSIAGPSYRGIDVKTKFPVARIKRIMQADEDVGKVAQATPTAVSKALELFMVQLVLKGTTEARTRNSKKVSAAHLKAALMKDSQFDFLGDICEKVQDATEKKASRTKSEDDSDEANGIAATKGKARAKRKGAAGSKMEEDSD